MKDRKYPDFFACRIFSNEEALFLAVKNGSTIATGFATSEPHTFYSTLWDHIKKYDLHDVNIRNALFMAPHRLLLGDALKAKGMFRGMEKAFRTIPGLAMVAHKANEITQKLEGLSMLIDHFKELQERNITFVSAFLGPAQNMIIPRNAITSATFHEYVGRNPSRMGIVDMQSVHFPDAPDALAYDQCGKPLFTVTPVVLTPPDENGDMSLGVANGCTMELLEIALKTEGIKVIVYINGRYPFTRGYHDSPNTINVNMFAAAAAQGRLFVVEDNAKIPALPAGNFDHPIEAEQKIAENVVNHIEMNRHLTHGRTIQVGFGGTGVFAMKALKNSTWEGRMYSEMLEPFTWELFEAGKIKGTHFIDKDRKRVPLDGKMVCTFSLGEEKTPFYEKMHKNPNLIVAAASRVVVQEAFNYGMGINNILSIDFQGHVNSSGRDQNHYSGVGGGSTIMRGLSRGGVAYLCLKSTHRTADGEVRSSIFPYLPQGTPISLIGPDLMGTREGAQFYLVTEHGIARINAMTQANFIRNIISVADPEFKNELVKKAWEEFRVAV